MGINQLIGDSEMEMLIEFMVENCPDLSIEEIGYSIKLAVAGHIEVKIDHWQAFTAQYIYPILVKYRLLRAKISTKYYDELDKLTAKEIQEAKPELSKEEVFLNNKKLCQVAFDNYKLKISVIGMHKVFDILWDLDLIPYKTERMNHFEVIAASELKSLAKDGGLDKSIYEAYLYSLKSKIDLSDQKALKESPVEFNMKLMGHNAIIFKTKEVAVRNIFAYLVETNTEINTYFETLNLNQEKK